MARYNSTWVRRQYIPSTHPQRKSPLNLNYERGWKCSFRGLTLVTLHHAIKFNAGIKRIYRQVFNKICLRNGVHDYSTECSGKWSRENQKGVRGKFVPTRYHRLPRSLTLRCWEFKIYFPDFVASIQMEYLVRILLLQVEFLAGFWRRPCYKVCLKSNFP